MNKLKSILKFLGFFISHPLLCLHYILKAPAWGQARLFAKKIPADKEGASPNTTGGGISNPFKQFVHNRINGHGIIKLDLYLDLYNQYFSKFLGKNISILEIGVFSGGSLDMWKSLFGTESQIFGVDIEENCKRFESPNIKIFIGNQEDRLFWKKTLPVLPPLDIIIDDGGHKAEQQIVTFEETFHRLKPGGVYVCEDIPGENNRFLSYMHGLTLPLYECELIEQPSKENHQGQTIKAGMLQKMIKAVHFLPFSVVVEKNEISVGDFVTDPKGDNWLPFELLRK